MGRGVALACSKPDPVAIRLTAKKTPWPNFEVNTEFNWLVYGVITTGQYTSCFMIFLSSLIFVYTILRLIMAWKISKIHATVNGCPELEAQKSTLSQFWKLQKDTMCQSWKLKNAPCPGAHPQYSQVWKCHPPPPPGPMYSRPIQSDKGKWWLHTLVMWIKMSIMCILIPYHPVDYYPANTRRLTSVGLMLIQRLRRWPNIKPTLVKPLTCLTTRVCWVFPGEPCTNTEITPMTPIAFKPHSLRNRIK